MTLAMFSVVMLIKWHWLRCSHPPLLSLCSLKNWLLYSQIFILPTPTLCPKPFVMCDPLSCRGGWRGRMVGRGNSSLKALFSSQQRALEAGMTSMFLLSASWPSSACRCCRLECVWRVKVFVVLFLGICFTHMEGWALLFAVSLRHGVMQPSAGNHLRDARVRHWSAVNWSVHCQGI